MQHRLWPAQRARWHGPPAAAQRGSGGSSSSGGTGLAARPGPRRAARQPAHAAAASKQQQQQPGSRNARLYELFDDGWGVDADGDAAAPAAPAGASPAGSTTPARTQPQQQAGGSAAAPRKAAARQARRGTPYVDMRSEAGVLGMTLLQRVLLEAEAEAEQAAGPGSEPRRPAASLDAVRAALAQSAAGRRAAKPKLPGYPAPSAAGPSSAQGGLADGYEDDEEDEFEDEDATPEFQLTFDQHGNAEFTDFSPDSSSSSSSLLAAAPADADAEDDAADLEGWGMSGWDAFDEPDEQQALPSAASSRSSSSASSSSRRLPTGETEDGAEDLALLRDLSNEDDWGLEGLGGPQNLGGPRRSLVDELSLAEAQGDADAGSSATVVWGGSAGTTGIDLEEQEELLRRYFRPAQVKKLMKDQVEVDASYSEQRKRAVGLGVSDHKMQETLRIVAGSAAGRRLISFRGAKTRPMMEKVRQAVFNMLQARAGTLNGLPPRARWLDLFAGTGSVGLEALSRGAAEAHFVEMDPAVVSRVLGRNIRACGFKGRAWTHTTRAEDFLRRAAAAPRFAGGPFDFVSVCPPYLAVDYPELLGLLDASPLLHARSVVFVEYPKQLSHQVPDALGPLVRVRDRRYGRTWVALYAAPGGGHDEGGGGSGEGGGGEQGVQDDPFLALGL